MTRSLIPAVVLSIGLAAYPAAAADEANRPSNQASVTKTEGANDAEAVPEPKLDDTTAVVLEKDCNGMPAKTRLISTPSWPNYYLAPVVDGIKQRTEMHWQECSWASEGDDLPHAIEIQLSKPVRGGRFQVTWAYDVNNDEGGRWWISRNYCVQVKEKAGARWQTVVREKNNQSAIGSYPLPDEPFRFVRIVQFPKGGDPARPNMMWVGQVELTE